MRASVIVLSLCMLITGTINTIATKYQDITVVGTLPDGTPLTFKHPAVQSACMFFGESLCLIPYFFMRWRKQKAKRRDPAYVPMHPEEKRSRRIGRIMAFAVPTLCDATGTTLMNIGLFYTYASTYQMLRGTLVLFAGMFTIVILRRQLYIHNWLGMVLITAGAALVGASSVIYQGPTGHNSTSLAMPVSAAPAGLLNGTYAAGLGAAGRGSTLHYSAGISRVASRGLKGVGDGAATAAAAGPVGGSAAAGWLGRGLFGGGYAEGAAGADVAAAPLFGDMLVVAAQMFTALQFILEEKFLVKYKVPALLAVGLEGCWGLVLCAIVLPITSLVRGGDGVPVDDALEAARSILANGQLAAAVYISVLSIAFFNFFGVSVTKSLSGAARATIDACRTLFIWLYALHAGWEQFHLLEVLGFVVLISGTSLYNEILKSCLPGTTLVTDHHRPQQTSRRRARASAAPDGAAAATDGAVSLTVPLLAAAAADGNTATAAAAAAGPEGWAGAPPVPLRRPAPAHQRVYDAAASQSGSGSWVYTMARSMRLGFNALSPQSLAATGGFGGQMADAAESEYGSESDAGSYLSSTPGGLLAASLGPQGRGEGSSVGGVLTYSSGGARGSSSGGLGEVVMDREVILGLSGPGGLGSGSGSGFGAAGGGSSAAGRVGGLSASLREAAGAARSGSSSRSPAAAGSGGGGGSGMRRSSSGSGIPRSASFGSVPRQSSGSSFTRQGSGRPPAPQS